MSWSSLLVWFSQHAPLLLTVTENVGIPLGGVIYAFYRGHLQTMDILMVVYIIATGILPVVYYLLGDAIPTDVLTTVEQMRGA